MNYFEKLYKIVIWWSAVASVAYVVEASRKSGYPKYEKLRPFKNLASTEDGIQFIADCYVVVCFEGECRGISYDRLRSLWPGLFLTVEDFANASAVPFVANVPKRCIFLNGTSGHIGTTGYNGTYGGNSIPDDGDTTNDDAATGDDAIPDDDGRTGEDAATGDDGGVKDDDRTGEDAATGDDGSVKDDGRTGEDAATGDDGSVENDVRTGEDAATGDDGSMKDDDDDRTGGDAATGDDGFSDGAITTGDGERKKRSHGIGCAPPPSPPVSISDGDKCCETLSYFTKTPQITNVVTLDVYGEYNFIAGGQLVLIGQCGMWGTCGNCIQEYSIVWLLAFKLDLGPPTMVPFKVASYCSCQ